MIARARALLAVAFLVGMVIVATQFPLGELTRARAAVGQATSQLSQLQGQNRQLAAQVASLREDGTVARLAHKEFGLVFKGQRSIVVLSSPGTRSKLDVGPLSATLVPKSDLVPSDATLSPGRGSGHKPAKEPGYWSRLLQRLEFWKAAP